MPQLTQFHSNLARRLANSPPSQNPISNPNVMAGIKRQNPTLGAHVQAIADHPGLASVATNGQGAHPGSTSGGQMTNNLPGGSAGAGPDQPSATDPTGVTNPNRAMSYSSRANTRRMSNIRHQLLGFAALTLAEATANQLASAKPAVAFKTERIVLAPSTIALGGSVSSWVVGNRNQTAGSTQEPFEVYGPDSYAGEVDFDICPAAISIQTLVTSTGAGAFYGGLVGLVKAKPIRPKHTKVMPFGLGSTSVAANTSAQIVLNPQIDFVLRKIALTEGTGFADAFIINSIYCGNQLQQGSFDPFPASMLTDKYDLFLDFDMIGAAVNLTINVTNITGSTAVFQGTTRGDVDPSQMSSGAYSLAA